MGMLAAWFAFRGETTTAAERLFLTTGVLGGFTTFSAFALDATLMWERHDVGAAPLYVGSSVLLSIAGLIGGMFLVRFPLLRRTLQRGATCVSSWPCFVLVGGVARCRAAGAAAAGAVFYPVLDQSCPSWSRRPRARACRCRPDSPWKPGLPASRYRVSCSRAPGGEILLSDSGAGTVYAFAGGKAAGKKPLITGLNRPYGLALLAELSLRR